jgi:Peptidase family M23
MPLLLAVVLLLAAPAAAAADRWRWPLRGEVLTRFHLAASTFAPGQHRGIDIAARAGAPVRSACAGRVRFAGRLPARGRAVSVVCGALVATYLELGGTSVARGAPVAAGDRIGTVAASHLQLGARRAGDPHGYVDPLTLLTDPPPPLGAAPRGERRPRRPSERPARVRAPRPTERPALAPAVRGVPLAAWLGLALLAAGTPLGLLRTRRRRRARLAAARAPAA